MKVKKLIKRLKEIKKLSGNCEVVIDGNKKRVDIFYQCDMVGDIEKDLINIEIDLIINKENDL